MKKKLIVIAVLAGYLCSAFAAFASDVDMKHVFDVKLSEKIPNTYRLRKEYEETTSNYNWKYYYSWSITPGFDKEFKKDIVYFGTVEKRIANADEDELLRDIKRLPKSYYPYIGPMLHTIPGMSGKILDLPGIKETKNQFPKVIDKRFADIPNIEFVSPELYLFLMPQYFGDDLKSLEFPKKEQKLPRLPRVKIKPQFLDGVFERVPMADFATGKPIKNKRKYDKRNYFPDAGTPLTQADVRAFTATLDDVYNFQSKGDGHIKLIMVSSLMNYWDEKNGDDKNVVFLRSAVNPCQMAARRIKWANLQSEFQSIIGKEGFSIDDWAYTCDKTIKAFRVAEMDNAYLLTRNLWRKGHAYKLINLYGSYTSQEKMQQRYLLEAMQQMFSASRQDVEAVEPFKNQIHKKLRPFSSTFLGSPLVMP